jgi:thioredoxin 1
LVEIDAKLLTDKTLVNDVIYFYTPLCGTCKLAKRMLDIVETAIPELNIQSCNINTASEIAEKYSIESVPCLIVFKDGEIKEKIYAFQSVDYIYRLFI